MSEGTVRGFAEQVEQAEEELAESEREGGPAYLIVAPERAKWPIGAYVLCLFAMYELTKAGTYWAAISLAAVAGPLGVVAMFGDQLGLNIQPIIRKQRGGRQ